MVEPITSDSVDGEHIARAAITSIEPSDADAAAVFLTESVTIATAGSLIGLAAGLAGTFALTAFMRAKTGVPMYAGVSWSTLAASAMSALLVGLVFGTYPAIRASRLAPIDAIQRE